MSSLMYIALLNVTIPICNALQHFSLKRTVKICNVVCCLETAAASCIKPIASFATFLSKKDSENMKM